MTDDSAPRTIQKTEWTNSLLQDLFSALRAKRDDATVRGFAKELIDEKQVPVGYLVHKTQDLVGKTEAERLDVLIRGRHAVDKEKTARAKAEGGLFSGLMRKFRR